MIIFVGMKLSGKILSFILIPVLLISITGTTIHIHYCGDENIFFSDIHIPGTFREDHQFICQHNDHSSHSHERVNLCQNDHHECCVDIQTSIKTDKVYKTYSLSFQPKPEVNDYTEIFIIDNPQIRFQQLDDFNYYYAEPDLYMISSLLL